MKLSNDLKHWGYHASLSEEGKKQHLEMSEKAAKLEEENEAFKRWLDLNAQTERYEAWRAYTQENGR